MTEGLTPLESEALLLSLKVAVWALVFGMPPALAMGWLLARREFPGKWLVDAAVHLPLVMPPVATGYLLLLLLGRRGAVGAVLDQWFGIVFAFRWTGAVVAAIVMAFPLMVRPIRLAIEAVDPALEEAAATMGAGRPAVFATVTLPLALGGVIGGAVLGFAKALGEFGATMTFVSNIPGETRTLPIAIHTALQLPGGDHAALRLTLIAVAVSVLAVVASELVARRLRRRRTGPA
jgi:molybdate transport system permease protein